MLSNFYKDDKFIDKTIFENYKILNLNEEQQDKIISDLPLILNKTKEIINFMEF
jgi:hypothetical protein